MRSINAIIIHCSATMGDVSADTITRWHKDRAFRTIGYHNVIRTNGTIEAGRDIALDGAHTFGYNRGSIGICLAGGGSGEADYTEQQWYSLALLVRGYVATYNIKTIAGHNNYTNKKTCPNFDVKAWAETL